MTRTYSGVRGAPHRLQAVRPPTRLFAEPCEFTLTRSFLAWLCACARCITAIVRPNHFFKTTVRSCACSGIANNTNICGIRLYFQKNAAIDYQRFSFRFIVLSWRKHVFHISIPPFFQRSSNGLIIVTNCSFLTCRYLSVVFILKCPKISFM